MLPNDPIICLSYVNTKLRDHYESLEEMCKSMDINKHNLIEKMKKIDYAYNEDRNQFI